MVTSANLSKQAWGETENKKGEIWIQSWECGVIIWPELFKTHFEEAVTMVPLFRKDMPSAGDHEAGEGGKDTIVGFRMPYNLPLEPYREEEKPWCASSMHAELDWKGQAWSGYRPC